MSTENTPTTPKECVAQALLDAPTNLISRNTFLWVMSHLPDSKEKGTNSTNPQSNDDDNIPYHHDKENIFEACGISRETFDAKIDEFNALVKNPELDKVSKEVKEIVNLAKKDAILFRTLILFLLVSLREAKKEKILKSLAGDSSELFELLRKYMKKD